MEMRLARSLVLPLPGAAEPLAVIIAQTYMNF